MTVLDGAGVRVNMQWEGSYGSVESNPSPFVPGANGSLDTAEAVNNITRITNFSKDTAKELKAGPFEGAFSMSWDLTNPWWLRAIFGTPSTTDNNDGSYTHTYSLGDADSFQILEGYETSTKAERTLKGCVAGSVELAPSVDDDGGSRVTMEGFYGDETTNTSVSLTSQDTLDNDTLNYSDAKLKRDGSAESIVQDATLTLGWETTEPVQAFNSRIPTDYLVGLFAPALDYSKVKQDANTIQDVYGGSSATAPKEDLNNAVSAELRWDNGKSAGSGINKHVYSLSTTKPESYDEDGVGDPASQIVEALSRVATDVTVDVTNETSSPP